MKLSEFIALSEEHKRSAVLTCGVPVAKRSLSNQEVILYQLHGFYVETFCNMDNKEIDEYRLIHDPKHLSSYLSSISIDNLF